MAGLAFFAVNCWILGIMVEDVGNKRRKDEYGIRGGRRKRFRREEKCKKRFE